MLETNLVLGKAAFNLKKWLAMFLSLLFIFPLAILPGVVSAAEKEDCVIAEIPLTYNITKEVPADGYMGDPNMKFDPIDLTAYNYGDLAVVFDLYVGGDLELFLKNLDGSLELTSGGGCDVEEINWSPSAFDWKENEWFRVVAKLNESTGTSGIIDLSRVNYVRLYAYPKAAVGETYTFKMCNVRLVDTSKGIPTDRIGDGTFTPEPPTWEIAPTRYATDDTVVMGYNLGDYMEPNTDEDATTTIQSLMEGLNRAGGGTLFIPEGEYVVSGNLIVPYGVTICGDWRAPTDENPEVVGTILKAYAGREDPNGTAFITMLPNSMVRDLSIWYPEQNPENVVSYPASIQMYKKGNWGADYTHVRNVTFVNSYTAVVQGPDGSGCPNVHNVYGTPLGMGLQLDGIYDVGRFDYINFAPKYWEQSGLPGSPRTDAAKDALMGQLSAAVAVNIQRVDWSYFAYMDISGYGVGVYFTNSVASPNSYSNGQVYGSTIRDCGVGILFEGVSAAGELFANILIDNCSVGIMDNYNPDVDMGNMNFSHITIHATDVAVQHDGINRMQLANCTITGGQIINTRGPLSITNCTFETEGPHISLVSGSVGTIVRGCSAKDGALEIDNAAMCPLDRNDEKVEVDEVDFLTAEQAADKVTKPARNELYVADVDATGATDVSKTLQAILDKVGKEGGGIVFLPAGHYRLEDSVTVPTGVELKGAVDIGRIPYNIGTIFKIYNTEGDASVKLKEGAGIVGIVFDYPEQGMSVDTIKKYPYAVQGQGKDVYVVNVSIRNGYDGVDLMSYRCDNHYVRYLAGYCFHNVIKVGKGAVGGVISNYQMNCGAWYNGGEDKNGAWPNSPKESDGTMASANLVNNLYVQENCDILIVGDVTDQILYDNFNYLGHRGALFIEENGKSASGWNVGNAYDYSTVGIEVQALTDMDFINVQIVSYNYMEDFNTDVIHHIYVADTYKGDPLNFFNVACWARPTSFLRVDTGTVNIYNSNYDSQSSTDAFLTTGKDAKLNLYNGALYSIGVKKVSSTEHLKNVTISGFFYEQELVGSAECNWINNMRRINRWSAPDNATFEPGSKLIFTENFTDYGTKTENGIQNVLNGGSFSKTGTSNGDSNVTISQKDDRDVARLFINEKGSYTFMQTTDMNLKAGTENSLYRVESRLQVPTMQSTGSGFATLLLYGLNANGSTYSGAPVIAFTQYDGVTVNDEHLTDWKTGVWYRVAIEVDLRDINNKTYRVSLYDDDYKLLASSKTIAFAGSYQGNTDSVGNLLYELSNDTSSTAGSNEFLVDYSIVSQLDPSAVQLGDINGDGTVNTTDARLALQYAVEKITLTSAQLSAGDVDGDGVVNTTDARLILQYAVEKINKFPAGK